MEVINNNAINNELQQQQKPYVKQVVKRRILRKKIKDVEMLEQKSGEKPNDIEPKNNTTTITTNTTTPSKTYRFTYSDAMIEKLIHFSQVHKLDSRKDYKEAWEDWVLRYNDEIEQEYEFLSNQGFQGDIYDKMYKSCRYYYGKKTYDNIESERKQSSNEETKPVSREKQPRKQYVHISKAVLSLIDTHITKHHLEPNFKPAEAYIDFCETNYYSLENYKLSILDNNDTMTEDEYENKLKKTYKNRYYLIVKKGIQSKHVKE